MDGRKIKVDNDDVSLEISNQSEDIIRINENYGTLIMDNLNGSTAEHENYLRHMANGDKAYLEEG